MKNKNLSGVVYIIPCLLLLGSFLLVADSCRRTVCEPGAAAGPGEVVPEGFVPLFNGINLDGWKVRQSENQDWQVVEGVIDCDPHEGGGDRNLWTARGYSDFELLVDWRIKESPYINRTARIILPDGTCKKDDSGKEVLIEVPNTDSGVFLRGRHKSQVNIWCWSVGSGEVWGLSYRPGVFARGPRRGHAKGQGGQADWSMEHFPYHHEGGPPDGQTQREAGPRQRSVAWRPGSGANCVAASR